MGKPTLAAGVAFQESIRSRFPEFYGFSPAFACRRRGVFPAAPAKLQIATVTVVHVALGTFPETETLMFRQNLS